VPKLQQCHY